MNQNAGFRIERRIKTWGEALMRCRVRRDFSHKDVADRVGVNKAQVKAWERDEGQPDALQLKKLYASISWLRGFEALLGERPRQPILGRPFAEPVLPPPPTPAEHEAAVAALEVPEEAPKNFGEALRRQRLKEGLDQDDLSELMGVSQGSVSRWELDKDYPVRAHYDRLVDLMPELRDAPLPFSRNIPKPVGPVGLIMPPAPPRMQVENLPPMDQIGAAAGPPGAHLVDREAMDYGRALLEVALARAALAAAQYRLSQAESRVALQEGKLREAADVAAREINETPEGGHRP